MITFKPSLGFLLAAATLSLLLLLLSVSRPPTFTAPWNATKTGDYSPSKGLDTSNRQVADTTSEIGRSSNATLGFSKVVVLGLKDRTDKRDAINLAASLTGFQVEFEDGVKGEDFPDKARPPGMNLNGGALGCWRGHLNIMTKMVQQRLSSIFIMEDDSDWDIRLLTQMPELAKGVRTLSNIPLDQHQESPYGDDWDIIWPGHCGDYVPGNDQRKYIIYNDPTVPPRNHQEWEGTGLRDYPNNTRVVHKAGSPICTFGYAVSLRGAKKILYALAVKGTGNWAIDNAMAILCRDGFMDIKCYSTEPMLMYHHRPAGSVSKDSDIKSENPEIVREKGWTANIVLSARLNMAQMIMGTEDWTLQW